MTEKRYKLSEPNGAYLIDNDRVYAHWINDDDKIIDLLNEQHEQINTLRESRRKLISANNEYRMRETELAQELSTLVDENEQLKQALNRNIEVKEFLLEEELGLNDTARSFIKEHNKERYK